MLLLEGGRDRPFSQKRSLLNPTYNFCYRTRITVIPLTIAVLPLTI
ncbi:hypothetical protein [Okeania sp. KiyG1]|nr:hypothetical protein [Okeania sp. KiyG1]